MAKRNLLNLEAVTKAFDIRALLDGVSLGVNEADRIGIVGRNGDGKSTLLKIMAGIEEPDSGRISKAGSTNIGFLNQRDLAEENLTVREVVLGNSILHEWARDTRIREVLTGLFGGINEELFSRKIVTLSGGERRRVNLAKLLIGDFDLLLLDEPTNHLDIEGVSWLAEYLKSLKKVAVIVITHDRWFLDEIADQIWEVVEGNILTYEGGY